MSCDSCHLEGHDEGILFEKTHPLRIYRSPTVRGDARDAALLHAGEHVQPRRDRPDGGRPEPVHEPHPHRVRGPAAHALQRDRDQPPEPLPRSGRRAAGLGRPARAEAPAGRWRGCGSSRGKADCVRCHPPPLFTTDQELSTRGHFIDVGTPRAFPLRTARSGNGVPGRGRSLAGRRLGRVPHAHHRAGRLPARRAAGPWCPTGCRCGR